MHVVTRGEQMPRSGWREPEHAEISKPAPLVCQQFVASSYTYSGTARVCNRLYVPVPAVHVQTWIGEGLNHTIRLTVHPVSLLMRAGH